jgi:hypothetical protein
MKKLRVTVEGKSYDVTVELIGEGGGVQAPSALLPNLRLPSLPPGQVNLLLVRWPAKSSA